MEEEDKLLYKEFLEGDTTALEKIILKYKNNLMYFILKYVKNVDLAEDIFQNVVVYILEKKEQYDFNYSLKTYLFTIAKSKSINCIKKNNNYTLLSEEDVYYEEEKLLEDIILTEERREKIINIMKNMSEEYQQVIYLTIIEGLSYEETAKIMEKSISQIKNLVHRARTKMKKMLIEEKVIQLKNNKIIKLIVWFILIGVISSGAVYAAMKIYENLKAEANLTPIFTSKIGNTDYNSIWVGTFNLAWNEFANNYANGKIEFENVDTALINELNRKDFTKEQIAEKDYYIKIGQTSKELREQIINECEKKLNFNTSELINSIDFETTNSNSITIYTLLLKQFEFLLPFDRLDDEKFGNSDVKVKYFGIDSSSNEELKENVEILFYNNNDDFSIKLNTKENEEIILYKVYKNIKDKSFKDLYQEVEEKAYNYIGDRRIQDNDILKIPYININTMINYNELCGKNIKGKQGMYIQHALQNVKLQLNESGGKISSEAGIKAIYLGENTEEHKKLYFTDCFVIFFKEKNATLPYLSLKVDNIEVLETSNDRD